MDKKIVGALSLAALFGASGAASAQALETVMNPQSYADLLQPIENASGLLKVAESMPQSDEGMPIQKAYHHHHHHHHHNWHHHHHNWHHHHHHHWGYHHHHHWYHHHHHHHHWGWPFFHHHHHEW